jgi:hypothetical protein
MQPPLNTAIDVVTRRRRRHSTLPQTPRPPPPRIWRQDLPQTGSGGSWRDRASSARVLSDAWRRRSSSRRVAAAFELSARGGGVPSCRSVLPELSLLRVAATRCGRVLARGDNARRVAVELGGRSSHRRPLVASGVPEPEPELYRDLIASEISF